MKNKFLFKLKWKHMVLYLNKWINWKIINCNISIILSIYILWLNFIKIYSYKVSQMETRNSQWPSTPHPTLTTSLLLRLRPSAPQLVWTFSKPHLHVDEQSFIFWIRLKLYELSRITNLKYLHRNGLHLETVKNLNDSWLCFS